MQVKTCQICGKTEAVRYVCRLCKREVCEACFNNELSLCSECYNNLKREEPLQTFPFKLFLLGFALIFVGVIFLIAYSVLSGNAQLSVGTVVIIGPIPIILGAGPYSVFAILLAVILTILAIVFFVLTRKRIQKT